MLSRILRKTRASQNQLDKLLNDDPVLFRSMFMQELAHTVTNRLNMYILMTTFVLAGLMASIRLKDYDFLLYGGIVVVAQTLALEHLRKKPTSLGCLGSAAFAWLYLAGNMMNFHVYRQNDYTGLSIPAIVAISILVTIVFNLIAIFPWRSLNLAANLLCMVVFYSLVIRPLRVKGIEIDRYIWQVWLLGIVICIVIHGLLRSRILSRLQRSAIEAAKNEIELAKDAIEMAAKTTRNIFDSINQAIFLVTTKAGLGTLYVKEGLRSPLCHSILNFPVGEDELVLDDVFFSNLDITGQVLIEAREALGAAFGGGALTWEINLSKLPDRVGYTSHNGKLFLRLSYAPLYSAQLEIKDVLITALDETEAIRAETERQTQKEQLTFVVELVTGGRERVQRGFPQIKGMLYQAEAIALRQYSDSEERIRAAREAFVPLHTAKGNSRTLSLSSLAQAIHETESVLNSLRLHDDQTDNLQRHFSILRTMLDRYADSLTILGWSLSKHDVLTLPATSYKSAMAYSGWTTMRNAVDSGHDHDHMIEQFLSPGFRRLAALKEPIEIALQRASTTVQKPKPHLVITADTIWIKAEVYDELLTLLPHIAGNIMDHGIERPSDRERKGKPDEGTVHISISKLDDYCQIAIKDDGQGAFLDVIRNKAVSLGLISDRTVLSDTDLVRLIMADGFSTKSNATEISGRGVGMAAVQKTIEALGGRVDLNLGVANPDGGRPLEICMMLPRHLLWE